MTVLAAFEDKSRNKPKLERIIVYSAEGAEKMIKAGRAMDYMYSLIGTGVERASADAPAFEGVSFGVYTGKDRQDISYIAVLGPQAIEHLAGAPLSGSGFSAEDVSDARRALNVRTAVPALSGQAPA